MYLMQRIVHAVCLLACDETSFVCLHRVLPLCSFQDA